MKSHESTPIRKDSRTKRKSGSKRPDAVAPKEQFPESAEAVESQVIDIAISLLLAEPACKKMAEGANGVIMRVDIGRLSEETRKMLVAAIPELGDFEQDAAIKILKIFSHDAILKESTRHQEAYDIISRSPDREMVDVPKPRLARSMQLRAKQAAEKCHEAGIKISPKIPSIAFEIMDYIDGEDLETHLCKKLIRARKDLFVKHYQEEDPDKFLDTIGNFSDYNNLRQYMEAIFGDEVSQEDRRDTFDNQEIYFEFLKKQMSYRGFFTKEQSAAFKRTLDLLHSKGFYHRDLHLRNVMIDKEGRFYIIDFDRAVKINPQDEEMKARIYFKNPEQDAERGGVIAKVFPDGWMVDLFEQVSKNNDDKKQEAESSLAEKAGVKEIVAIRKRAESAPNSDLGRAWEKVKQEIKANEDLKKIIDGFLTDLGMYGAWGSDNAKLWLGVLLESADQGRKKEVTDFCRQAIENKDTSNFVRSKLVSLLEYL